MGIISQIQGIEPSEENDPFLSKVWGGRYKGNFDPLIFDSTQSRSYLQAMGYSEEQMRIVFERTAQRIKNGEAPMMSEEEFYKD